MEDFKSGDIRTRKVHPATSLPRIRRILSCANHARESVEWKQIIRMSPGMFPNYDHTGSYTNCKSCPGLAEIARHRYITLPARHSYRAATAPLPSHCLVIFATVTAYAYRAQKEHICFSACFTRPDTASRHNGTRKTSLTIRFRNQINEAWKYIKIQILLSIKQLRGRACHVPVVRVNGKRSRKLDGPKKTFIGTSCLFPSPD